MNSLLRDHMSCERVCERVRKVKTEMKVKGHYIQDNVLSPEELHLT